MDITVLPLPFIKEDMYSSTFLGLQVSETPNGLMWKCRYFSSENEQVIEWSRVCKKLHW